ncbi:MULTISPECIES: alpha-N-arabinofuranosidase [Asticcacaulis]|uniref:alpha-N-arabinofuranosidase n=1 Tax=Asticcacaulis TaxID=76890 RepID=UPI001AE83C56|nr:MULTISPECIES: alpha-L-arabinofuranosidase C-terminal domain-containing protein [Asticcacaulis]MBP2161631.1 alpha-N-arabinofuranosidase [Asticcacaulis solisilvae]MDR6802676.1 alpha-N-arabinofuranosidase [Asticcacaulis sp. BE141]
MKQHLAGALAALLLAAAPALAGTPVTVDTTKPGPQISRHIFGQFAEHLGTGIYPGIWVGEDSKIPNTRGIRNDVVTALKAVKVPNIRWPGGCYADDYHWRNGIGAKDKRPSTVNYLWGRVAESNHFGTHEFMDFIEMIGSEAYVSGNVGSGTPQEMSDWLEYMTADPAISSLARERVANGRKEPFKVPIFGIGNESWGCGGSMTPEHYANLYRNFATFARNYDNAQQLPNGDFDPNGMKRIASGANVDDYKWTEVMMEASTKQIFSWTLDGLSLHYYSGYNQWPPHYSGEGFGEDEYAHVIKSAYKMDELVTKHSAIMDKYDPKKKVILAVDEWGTWYTAAKGSNPRFLQQQNSQRDAIVAAVTINIFTRHADRVRMANIAQMINVLQAMILTEGDKMVLTPTYHVFKLYVPFQDATFLPVQYDAGTYTFNGVTLPALDVTAAKGKDGKVYVSLTNINPKAPAEIDLAALGLKAKGAKGETLAAPKIDSINTFDNPNVVAPKAISAKAQGGKLVLKLPPQSVTVVALD